MVKFSTLDPSLKYRTKEGNWLLLASISYEYDGRTFLVPEGFETDLASIPRIFRARFPQVSNHIIAAIGHDYLYANGMYTREWADDFFLAAMKELGVKWRTRYMMYWAVRAGGNSFWKGA